jgi:S1-C subfamily serine protease
MARQRLPAVVVDKNVNRDLAVLQVSEAKFFVVTLGDPESVAVGSEVYAVGSPGGTGGILEYSVTRGIVSGHRRFASETNASVEIELIQTDAAISPGNSGGPLATLDGHVIGINTWKMVGKAVQGLNFSVSINEARKYFYRHMD